MSQEHKLEIIESPQTSKVNPLDLNDIEMVFGKPTAPKTDRPDVHLITNEKKHGTEPLPYNHFLPIDADGSDNTHQTQPLLEPDRGRQKPPLAGPEIDDLDDETQKDRPKDAIPYPGIDDGLLDSGGDKPEIDHHDDVPENPHDDKTDKEGTDSTHDNGAGTDDDGVNGLDNRFGTEDRPISPFPPGSIPDVNTYQQKKNLAQGMMDLALLSANANQLRYVLESASTHPYYYPSLAFISLSIILQIAVGVGLILNSRYNVKDDKDICKADKINNMTVLGIFLITIVNVFITSFSVATPTVPAVPLTPPVQQTG